MPKSNSPFPLRHVDFHLIHECLGLPHSPHQTTARSLYALPHNDATKAPVVTMGCPKFTPQTAPSLRRSPTKANTPIPSPTPLSNPNSIWIHQLFCHSSLLWPFPNHFRHLLLLTLKKEAGYCVTLGPACVLTGHIQLFAAAVLDDVVRDTIVQTYRLLVALRRLTIAVRTRQVCDLHI